MKPKAKLRINHWLTVAVVVLGITQVVSFYVLSRQTQEVEKRRAEETFRLIVEVEKLKQAQPSAQ